MDWFVIATKPKSEKTAEFNLRRQSFQVFSPLFEKNSHHARRVYKVLQPFSPSCLFVRFNARIMPWLSINSTIKLRHILKNNYSPHPVAKKLDNVLLDKLNLRGTIKEQEQRLTIGSEIEVATGAMQGHFTSVPSANECRRIKILLSIMGEKVISSIWSEGLEL